MADLTLSIKFEWEETPGGCEPCKVCNEPIYLKRYVPAIVIGGVRELLSMSFCESCYNLIDNGGDV